jgi:hypothetical protein
MRNISCDKYVHSSLYRQGIQDGIDEIFFLLKKAEKRSIKSNEAGSDIYDDMAPIVYAIAKDLDLKTDFLHAGWGLIDEVIYYSYMEALECMKEVETIKTTLNQLLIDRSIRNGVPLKVRYAILKRDCYKCRACGNAPSYDPSVVLMVDHIIPLSKGGEDSMENYQTLCQFCNAGKSDYF